VKLRSPGPAYELVECARREAAELSFEVGVDELVLAVARLGSTLADYGADAETVRERIRARERDALASLGISLESVRDELEERFGEAAWSDSCDIPISPDAKRILELATRRRRHVTPDQLLAALIEQSPRARRLLFEIGVPVGTLQGRLRR
jgi:hypothetical protein